MKILLLTGSPRSKSNSNALATAFAQGAAEAGHTVQRFDVANLAVAPCLACDWCRDNDGQCVTEDDMQQIYSYLPAADMIVFATPIYYFGMSAQLKMAIDRFYAINSQLRKKKAALLAVCGDDEDSVMLAIRQHYLAICDYCNWDDCGMVLATGLYDEGDIEGSHFVQQALQLGKQLGE